MKTAAAILVLVFTSHAYAGPKLQELDTVADALVEKIVQAYESEEGYEDYRTIPRQALVFAASKAAEDLDQEIRVSFDQPANVKRNPVVKTPQHKVRLIMAIGGIAGYSIAASGVSIAVNFHLWTGLGIAAFGTASAVNSVLFMEKPRYRRYFLSMFHYIENLAGSIRWQLTQTFTTPQYAALRRRFQAALVTKLRKRGIPATFYEPTCGPLLADEGKPGQGG